MEESDDGYLAEQPRGVGVGGRGAQVTGIGSAAIVNGNQTQSQRVFDALHPGARSSATRAGSLQVEARESVAYDVNDNSLSGLLF